MTIVTGSIAYDSIMNFPGSFSDHILPDQIHNINLSFIVNSYAKRRGGTAGNLSYTMGLLGVKHKLFAYAGNDFGDYKKAFDELGIDTSNVAIDDNDATAIGIALADKNQNQIWAFYPGAASRSSELDLKTIAKDDDFIVVGPQGVEGSLSFIKQCIAMNLRYMFDPGFILTQVSNEDLELGLKHADIIIGNDYEIQLMQDRISHWDTIIKGKIVITTLGEKGTHIKEGETETTIAPATVKTVATTTGAGDAWRGGFIAGRDLGFDLITSAEMGSIAGAYAVEHIGTQEHTYTKEEFTKRYKETYNKDLNI